MNPFTNLNWFIWSVEAQCGYRRYILRSKQRNMKFHQTPHLSVLLGDLARGYLGRAGKRRVNVIYLLLCHCSNWLYYIQWLSSSSSPASSLHLSCDSRFAMKYRIFPSRLRTLADVPNKPASFWHATTRTRWKEQESFFLSLSLSHPRALSHAVFGPLK